MMEIDKIAWIEIKEGKILSTLSKGKLKYYIPGGKREEGESDQQTLIREIREELSVEITPATIKYLCTFRAQADSHPDGVVVKMTCYTAKYSGILKADNEIEEIKWLTYSDMDLVSHVDMKIFEYLREQGELK